MEKTLNKKVLLFGALIVSIICITIISLSPVLANMKNQEAAVAKSTEQKARDISGRRIISTLITEDFSSSKKALSAQTRQMIFIDGKSYEVVTENINTEITGGIYDVKGTLDVRTNKVYLTSANFLGTLYDGVKEETLDKKLTTSTLGKAKPRKVAVFLFNYQNSSEKEITPEEIEEMMFGEGKFAKYFKEASYNRQVVTGDVFGWNTIPSNATSLCQANTQNLESAVTSNSVNLNEYTNIFLITMCPGFIRNGSSNTSPTPHIINGTTYNKVMTWANIGTQNWDQPSNQMSESMDGEHILNNLEHLMIHEFGHALGLLHAHGIQCQGVISTNNCQSVALGNYFDTMAYDTIGLHFNAWSKAKLGWFSGTELRTITQSGIYSINDLESANINSPSTLTGNTKAYKIKPSVNSNKTPIWIEFRKAIGFDKGIDTPAFGSWDSFNEVQNPPYNIYDNQEGIMIYREGSEGNTSGQISPINARLMYLRNSPNIGNSANPYQVSLNVGQTYTEPRYGLTITTLPSISPSARRFEVEMNPDLECTNLAPYLSVNYPPTQMARGSSNYIWVRLINMDYIACPNSNFLPSINGLPSGVVPQNINSDSITSFLENIEPDGERIFGLNIYVGLNTQTGQYNFPITLTNTSSGLSQTFNLPMSII